MDFVKDGFDLCQRIKIVILIDNVLVNNIVRGIGKFIPNAQVQIGFTFQDSRPSQLKMLKRAVSGAKEKAEIMAEAAGAKLGKVLEINYNFSHIETYSQARNIHSNEEAKESTPDALDITPDDMVNSDRVDVVFELITSRPLKSPFWRDIVQEQYFAYFLKHTPIFYKSDSVRKSVALSDAVDVCNPYLLTGFLSG